MSTPRSPRYLRRDTLAEPLVNRWWANPHLVSPMTAPFWVVQRQLPMLRSFVANPALHAAAARDPQLLGSSYLVLPTEAAPAVAALLAEMTVSAAHLTEFAAAVRSFDAVLQREAVGASLLPLYARLPAPLRGLVELVYDVNGHPSIRFLESLMYRTPLANRSAQSVVLSRHPGDSRPFVLSTPRLPAPGDVELRLEFADERLDALFAARHTPVDVLALAETLGVSAADRPNFDALFTDEAPEPVSRVQGPGARIRYFGHACVLMESQDTVVLLDPLIAHPSAEGPARLDHADLPPIIDVLVITHAHHDHVVIESLLPLRHRVRRVVVPPCRGGTLADPSLRLLFQNLGFREVVELDELASLPLGAPGERLLAVPFFGEHGDLAVRSKSCWQVRVGGASALFCADTQNVAPEAYAWCRDEIGTLDALFIGLECDGAPQSWLYGPLCHKAVSRAMDQSRRLSSSTADQCQSLIDTLAPAAVYTYAMGREPWLGHITTLVMTPTSTPIVEADKLLSWCVARGLPAEHLYCQKTILLPPTCRNEAEIP